jgi:signal peptide peptidase SppA
MNELKYAHVMSALLEHPWAITRQMLSTIASVMGRRIAGHGPNAEDIHAALVNRKNLPQPEAGGSVAVIPVYGVLAPRAGMMTEMSGGTSFEALTAQLREAMGSSAIASIVFDVDSPGGSVAGATEFAREIMAARQKKPIIAQAQYTMCSAAYWLAAACTEIVASPSSTIGSVGVYTIHDDLSEALKAEGITRTYISAGKFKTEGNEAEPLSDGARERMAAVVARAYDQFVGDISKGRGVALEDVRSGFGQGAAVGAEEAKSLGMIDSIATLDHTVARLVKGTDTRRAAARAERAQVERALVGLSL